MTALVAITVDTDQLVRWVVAAAGLVGALAYLGKRVFQPTIRRVRAIAHVIDRELDYNHGGSIKDDVHGIAVTVGQLSRDVTDLTERFNDHITNPSGVKP
jgi:hypothetical protein